MTRDEAIKIAAGNTSMTAQEFGDDRQWALAVMARADALLAAMVESETTVEECCEAQARITEARVVREIVADLRHRWWSDAANAVERGYWRVKGEK